MDLKYRNPWPLLMLAATGLLLTFPARVGFAEPELQQVDTALILAVDVSNSVDDVRYRLQLEGIARAIEDAAVIDAITSGANGGILLTLVEWADKAEKTIDWHLVRNADQARAFAGKVRRLTHRPGEYTCLARMLAIVRETILDDIPMQADRIVLDVSGDGADNCALSKVSDEARDALTGRGVTINGLPIIVKGENDLVGSGAYRAPGFGFHETLGSETEGATTLDKWFIAHLIGGPAAFLYVAHGYEDFGRAFRQKFVTEISLRDENRAIP